MPDEYTDLAATYDLTPPYLDRTDLQFYLDYARQSRGPVLELGCGTGRICVPIAAEGIDVVGLDLSPAMLAICRRKLDAQPDRTRRRVRLLRADMADFVLRQRFGLIVVPFRAFQHLLEAEQQLACLRCVRRHLRPDGRFILDVFDPNYRMLAGPFPSEQVTDFDVTFGDGTRLIRRSRILGHEKSRQLQHVEFEFERHLPDGSVQASTAVFYMRCIFRPEAEHLLARAGLSVEHLFGDYRRTPYPPGNDLIFVCRRAGKRRI
ncbi:MAG TPA: class I SAM-dependent methyltransferase [Phycisphaerae bacterium]|nr:class I SAM-dependent methyltransferase [Phycisphaerae bacterium]